jgi:replicative DNA helicase
MNMHAAREFVNTESTGSSPGQTPHNIEAEQSLLGALLLNNSLWDRLPPIEPDHFYDPLHAEIFDSIGAAIKTGKRADPITLKHLFEGAAPISETMTVTKYLGTLAANASSISNALEYARLVTELAARRRLIDLGMIMVEQACNPNADAKEIVAETEKGLLSVSDSGSAETISTFEQSMDRVLDSFNEAYGQNGKPRGLPTGLVDLDKHMGGLVPGNLIIIAGRPGMGKSSLAVNIAWHLAELYRTSHGKEGCPVQFNSMEMGADEITSRILATKVSIPGNRLSTGLVSQNESSMVVRVGLDIKKGTPFVIDDAGGLNIGRIASKARRAKRKNNFGLLVIDYLQLIMGPGGGANRVQEVTEITVGLKALAKELKVPIIALSQLSRKVEDRADKRPQLADLRESGSIEQDADVVLFVYREEYYVERERPSDTDPKFTEWQKKMRSVTGKAEVIIGKARGGSTGIVPCAWDGSLTKFSNLAHGGGR